MDDFIEQLYNTDDQEIEFTTTATCHGCGVEYPYTFEFFAAYYRDGKKFLRGTCHSCRKAAVKRSYAKHRTTRLAYMRDRYYQNKE